MKIIILLASTLMTGCSINKANQPEVDAKLICGLGYSFEDGAYTTSIEKVIDDENLDKSYRKELKENYESCILKQVKSVE